MPAHKHAALMALYAQDAMETETPWERWQFRSAVQREWTDCLPCHLSWYHDAEYRRKSRTIRIGEYDVPEPVREAPAHRTQYWVVAMQDDRFCIGGSYWDNDSIDWHRLQRGLIHLTREAAELHGRALVSLTEVK